jgi:hypothetical protein
MNPLVIETPATKETITQQDEESLVEKSKLLIPNEYIPIYLSSEACINAPKLLHFRDYSMDDALELNVLDEDDQLKAFVKVLNNIVWEDFDCANLHVKEMMEIVYTLHANYIGTNIEKSYHLDETLPEGKEEGQLDYKDNIVSIELPLKCIARHSINEDAKGKKRPEKERFKKTFTVTDKDTKSKIVFRLVTLKDILVSQELCKEKYKEQEKEFFFAKKTLNKIRAIKDEVERDNKLEELLDNDEEGIYDAYYEYQINYEKDYARMLQAFAIVKYISYVDGKEVIQELQTIEERLDIYRQHIARTMWTQYNEIVTEYDFGIVENVTFFSDALQKNITRRFQFQYLDFLSVAPKENSRRFSVSFD